MKINFFGDKVIALFSEKKDESMRLHGESYYDALAARSRGRFLTANNVPAEHLVRAELIHSNHSEIVSDPKKIGISIKGCDALVTDQKEVYLSTTAADCFPVYFYDALQGVIGVIHAGWKGISRGVLESTLEKAEAALKLNPRETHVYVGPGIRKCHFEVKKDVAKEFRAFTEVRQTLIADEWVDKTFVDLEAAIRERLVQIGVPLENIGFSEECTYCATETEPNAGAHKYFSFRRDKSDPLQTAMTVIGMKQ